MSSLIRDLTLLELRMWLASGNPDPIRFPEQQAAPAPVADEVAAAKGIHPYSVPTVTDLFEFVAAYSGETGMSAGKSLEQRRRAAQLGFDLEIKHVPFQAERYSPVERIVDSVVQAIQQAGMEARTVVRSFDHRLLQIVRRICPTLKIAVLVGAAVPVNPPHLVQDAGASIYCPLFEYLDSAVIEECHQAGIRVLTWTVNAIEDWNRLIGWGVDGITTDYPHRLQKWLDSRHMERE